MKRRVLIALAVLLMLAATLVPAALGIYGALRTLQTREHERLGLYADAALLRVETVSNELGAALRAMEATNEPRCSAAYLAKIRAITFENRYVQDAGAYDEQGHWLCSTLLGVLPPGPVRLRAPDWSRADGLKAWFVIPRLLGSSRPMLMLGRAGNYIVTDPLSLVDVIDARDDGIAVFNTDTGQLVAANPVADPVRMTKVFKSHGAIEIPQRFYSIRRSHSFPFEVIVSEPRLGFADAWRQGVWGGLLAGLLVGGLFAWLVLRRFAHRLSLHGELQRAIARREIKVLYQPIVELATRRCVGAEALARWQHGGEAVAPDVFIALAESRGLIQPLTDLVLERIITELGEFLHTHPDCYVSINVSAVDLSTRRFVDHLGRRLAGTGIRMPQLRIEATERGFVDAAAATAVIQAFRNAGHPVYIDDFGTGYSSLSYLQTLPIDVLKIDKSFVDKVGRDAASSSVAPHIIGIAQTLGLEVVAEGVEREDQAEYLSERGARYGQGWLFSAALTAEAFARFVEGGPVARATERSTGTGRPQTERCAPPPGVRSSARSQG